MKIGRVKITASRWPWMIRKTVGILGDPDDVGKKYGWGFVSGMGRFGGGWQFCLGIEVGRTSFILNLIWGMIHVSWYKEKDK